MTAINRLPFLLEIGSEEIPARFVPGSMTELSGRFAALLAAAHLGHAPLRVLATPRRLTLLCDGIDERQLDREVEIKGPPVSVAFGADGTATRAAEAFARKAGIELASCGRGSDAKGEYLVARTVVPGRAASAVLAESLPGLVLGLPFRKVMRWGTGSIEYARPLQWLACLLGAEVVDFTVGTLRSGRVTRGHRTLAGDARRELAEPGAYLSVMDELAVVPDPAERRRRIVDQAHALLAESPTPARWREDAELLEEVVYLCEHPTVLRGSFADTYFELPEEVIVTALKSHQRYFAVERGTGSGLLPWFLAVRDGGREHLDRVVAGNERVLRARLDDALFYWNFDQQKTPDEHTQGLATVTWMEGFGSVLEKTRRVAALVEHLWSGGLGDGGEIPAALRRAAVLCKFDLVTEMIKDGKEFTKLEGVIGSRYAARAGEAPAVCAAIERYHLPRQAAGELPGDRLSGVLAVADRLDTIAGCWLAGFAPTGAKDPYALRRHTLSILRIVVDLGARLDLEAAVIAALAPYASLRTPAALATAAREILDFIRIRLEGHLVETRGAALPVVRAVLAARRLDPTDLLAWIGALDRFKDRDDFLLLATGFKRCTNILEGEVLPVEERLASVERWLGGGADREGRPFSRLPEPAERDLANAVAAGAADLLAGEARGDYVAVFQRLSGLGPAIDRFFETVRVNAEDATLRQARHGFLREIHAIFLRFADFAAVAPGED
jgi:glycyl-tRNA synthetase beta chain